MKQKNSSFGQWQSVKTYKLQGYLFSNNNQRRETIQVIPNFDGSIFYTASQYLLYVVYPIATVRQYAGCYREERD